ncbi:CtsR family transcriptional regulator [Clostridium sp. CX1]|uniref:Transcriptional regulator CtsR n=1 Tax=Clostridium tanneri TaxID=3037988 RepID=A0ABU4JQ16_9CLOT|nr:MULTISPECIES: CtsR family transcriptional regulator [unclassified Clostridium]MCT8976542.1 CtsR family transcriptional regulator [Clostridium sp. CX1]MDW8800208.1 CtsR family transcriptional regulator [Clostridium sp. A1-XYC3]
MTRLSDVIEEFIKEMLKNSDGNQLQIVRNELANYFKCAPSQINYVLTTRFTVDRGYYIESRRGGGGCILIKQIQFYKNKSLVEILNEKIGDSITYSTGVKLIEGLLESGIISEGEFNISKAAINDRTLSSSLENRNKLRADILKSIVMVVLNKA